MFELELKNRYRLIDKELILFSDKLRAARDFERKIFVPDIKEFEPLKNDVKRFKDTIRGLDAPDRVFSLLRDHFCDFATSLELQLAQLYSRPAKHISPLWLSFYSITRRDFRDEGLKAEILIDRFSQTQSLLKGIKTWMGNVSGVFLQELIYAVQTYVETMRYERDFIPKYFPSLSSKLHSKIVAAIEEVSEYLSSFAQFSREQSLTCNPQGLRDTSDEDVILIPEEDYRDVLSNELGVNLDELLSWHEEEVDKTRSEIFEIAGKIGVAERAPKTIGEVLDILNKYAGPADSPDEMYRRVRKYLDIAQKNCEGYVWLPEGEHCRVLTIPEALRRTHAWGGCGGICPHTRPIVGEMFLNQYNYKAISDGWIKVNAVHESYPGHHVQFVRCLVDRIPETMKLGAKHIPLIEGTAHRSERVFEFDFPEDPFYPLFVAYRRHHTSVRIKADLSLRYFGKPIGDAVELYMNELGFDRHTARVQVKAQENMLGYFTSYYYGMKKLCDFEKKYGFDEKTYTGLLFSAGKISVENFEKFLTLNDQEKHSFTNDFASIIQF